MLSKKVIFIFLIMIIAKQNFAQTSLICDSTKIDSIKTSQQQLSEHLPLLNLSDFNEQKSERFHKSDFIIPKNNILNWQLLEFKLSKSIDSINRNTKKDDFEFAKKRLQKLLAKEYEEIPNYNLGIFGKILGTTNSLIAVILGILSLL